MLDPAGGPTLDSHRARACGVSLPHVLADLRHRPRLTSLAILSVDGAVVKFESVGTSPAGTAWDAEAVRHGRSPLPNATIYEPIGPDTVFCLGSITKTITAIAVMQQVVKGT